MATVKDIKRALYTLIKASQKELEAQGHKASGETSNSFEVKVIPGGPVLIGQVLGSEVLLYLDTGTKPHWVPIAPLKKWANIVGTGSIRERESLAYAVQRSIATVGTPSPGSFRFSSNGRRTNFSEFARKAAQGDVDKILESSTGEEVEAALENIFKTTGLLRA
jgi:hypothetical protein